MKNWIKIALACLMVLSVCGCSTKTESKTYTSTAAGFGGDVTVTLTIAEDKITDVVIEGASETESIGQAAFETLKEQILAANGAEIDGVSGATVTSSAVKQAVKNCLNEANGTATTEISYTAGTYEGTGTGMLGAITVSVTVSETAIESIEVVSQGETQMIGWGLETSPVELLPKKIVEAQSLSVDSVTGATVTSGGIKAAVKDALAKSGVDVSLLEGNVAASEKAADETLEADVVIAGAGGAGLFAALEAASNGANVIVVEKAGVLTGNSTRNGGLLMASGTNYTDVTNEELSDYIINYIGRGNVDAERIIDYTETSSSLLEYFISIGTIIDCVSNIWDNVVDLPVVYMANFMNENNEVEIRPGFNTCIGTLYMTPLYNKVIEAGATVIFNTPMTEILMNENNEATGIKCERADGSVVTINADAVIIATGGYAGDNEKLKENSTMTAGDFVSYAAGTDTGDGIWLAEEIGAAVRYETDITTMSPTANSVMGNLSYSLMVTPEGKRFTREYDYFFSVEHDLNREGYSICYQILDASFDNAVFANVIAAAENGTAYDIITADSVEELATKTGMDKDTLAATLSRYNELCEKGVDEDYEKAAEWMMPINTTGEVKLIALKHAPTICDTYGGIDTDASTRVLNTNGEVIKNLYAAGATALTNWVDYEYPGCGYGFGVSVYGGHKAGLTALTDLGFENVVSVLGLE